MQLLSNAFVNGEEIPAKYTCDGNDFSPPLSIKDVIRGAKSLALIMDDPDAPGGVFVHWVIWNIPPDTASIPEKVPPAKVVSSLGGAKQGVNDFGKVGYRGPCPPPGPPHRYIFKLYTLDKIIDLGPGASKAELEGVMQGHILAQATLMGRYAR